MNKIWLIFQREYWSHLTRKSYLLFTFGFPAFILVMPLVGAGLVFLALRQVLPESDPRPVGVVDASGYFSSPDAWSTARPADIADLVGFDSEAEAITALETGDIQAYYLISPDYLETGAITLTHHIAPTGQVQGIFDAFVRQRLRRDLPREVSQRTRSSALVFHRSLDGQREFSLVSLMEWALIYALVYFTRLAGSFTAGYMLDSIASEADDSTLEMLLTTVSPIQFVLGKLCALLAVGATQLGVWGLLAGAAALAVARAVDFDVVQAMLDWRLFWLALLVLVSAYILDQIIAGALGILRVRGGAGLLLFNTFNWFIGLALIYGVYFLPRNPNTFLAVVTSLIPFTAPVVLLVRNAVSTVPTWQTILSVALLWGTIGGGAWLLSVLLKRGLITNAQPFSLRMWLKQKLFGAKRRVMRET